MAMNITKGLHEQFMNDCIPFLREGEKLEAKVFLKRNRVLHGIALSSGNSLIVPVAYLEEVIGEDGIFHAKEFVETMQQSLDSKDDKEILAGTDLFSNPQWVLNQVQISLVNRQANLEWLETLPHRLFLDLAVVYRVSLPHDKKGNTGVIWITNSVLEKMGLLEKDLWKAAMRNMDKLLPSILLEDTNGDVDIHMEKLARMIKEEGGIFIDPRYEEEMKKDAPFFIAGFPFEWSEQGAAVLLHEELLSTFAEKIDHDLLIFASSVTNLMIIPEIDFRQVDYDFFILLAQKNVSCNIPLEDRLSGSLYRYTREGILEIVERGTISV